MKHRTPSAETLEESFTSDRNMEEEVVRQQLPSHEVQFVFFLTPPILSFSFCQVPSFHSFLSTCQRKFIALCTWLERLSFPMGPGKHNQKRKQPRLCHPLQHGGKPANLGSHPKAVEAFQWMDNSTGFLPLNCNLMLYLDTM